MKRVFLAGVLLLVVAAALSVLASHRREVAHDRQIRLGEEALARGDAVAAIEAFSGAIYLKPSAMIGHLKRGEAYQRRNELDAALRDIRRAVDLDPHSPRAVERLGDVNHALKRFERAAERYEHALRLDDRSPRVLYKLGLAHFSAGQPQAAVEVLRRAIALDDRLAEAHYLLGLSLRDLQQDREAARALERAVHLAPALLQAREVLAQVHGRLGRPEDRIQELDRLRALDATPAREVTLALAYARSGRTEYAVAALGRALDRYPDYPYTRIALGRIWLEIAEARQDRVALGKALGALEAAPPTASSSDALTLLGRALLLAGDVDRAERTLQEAAAKRPVEPSAFLALAEVAERRGHILTALDALLDYHALAGDDPDPRRRAAFAARVATHAAGLGDTALAAEWSGRAGSSPHR